MKTHRTPNGTEFRMMPPAYLDTIRERMPLDLPEAQAHVANCGSVICYAQENKFFGCYEVITNEDELNDCYTLISSL